MMMIVMRWYDDDNDDDNDDDDGDDKSDDVLAWLATS